MTTSFKTNPVSLRELMQDCHQGKLRLPDFQRPWVWDQDRIIDLLASISEGFPVGALMTLEASGEVTFATQSLEGAPPATKPLEAYLLDGQQRMTSLYQAAFSRDPVVTRNAQKRPVKLHFYFDIKKALDPDVPRREAIVAVPEDRIIRTNFGRDIELDLSNEEAEFAALYFPIDRVFDMNPWMLDAWSWAQRDGGAYVDPKVLMNLITDFSKRVINNFTDYQVPVITLGKDTSRAAVCLVFEKVNTGGKALDAFELVTAIYASEKLPDGEEFYLRVDWNTRRSRLAKFQVLKDIQPVEFLQAVSLLHTKVEWTKAKADGCNPLPAISATRASILETPLSAYKEYRGLVEQGYADAAKFLHGLGIFRAKDLPYQPQLAPLAAIFAELGKRAENVNVRKRLAQWYWCGVFGELYGSAVESRFALDIRDVPQWAMEGTPVPQTVERATFQEARLRTLRTRLSAAYKGVHALLMDRGAKDFLSGKSFDEQIFFDENVDIHHIFPRHWCEKRTPKIEPKTFNSIINKTPLSARTNRIIGGVAPSVYVGRLQGGGKWGAPISPEILEPTLRTHEIDPELLRADDFYALFDDRRRRLLGLVERAMGKPAIREDVAPPELNDVVSAEEEESELADTTIDEVDA